jgi:hypothetical protein
LIFVLTSHHLCVVHLYFLLHLVFICPQGQSERAGVQKEKLV